MFILRVDTKYAEEIAQILSASPSIKYHNLVYKKLIIPMKLVPYL